MVAILGANDTVLYFFLLMYEYGTTLLALSLYMIRRVFKIHCCKETFYSRCVGRAGRNHLGEECSVRRGRF